MKHFSVALVLLFALSCKKNNDTLSDTPGELSIEFDNIAGDKNLQLNTGVYTNAAGEQFSISVLQYFISNIKLKKSDGTEYVVPQDSSYFMINESDEESQSVELKVPQGDYTSLTFTVGVDSLRSTMDISKRTGVLDPANYTDHGMYWGWNSGYIFLKMEGKSAVAPGDGTFRYHIGGFGGYSAPSINNIKQVTLNLSTAGAAKVREDKETNIHLLADVLKVFTGASNISIAANATVMSGTFSANIANNYAGMFRHDHTEN